MRACHRKCSHSSKMSGQTEEDSKAADDSITDVRYNFCKDWVEKQNSECAKKSQQNKNDIQFIIQNNADRKKFLLSAAEDDATVPNGVGEPSVEPKAVKLQKLRTKDVRMECGWLSCNHVTEDYKEFQDHCRNHISDLQVSEEDGKVIYSCLWDSCKHSNTDFDEMCRHMNYHAYHGRLLGIGFNAQATLKLACCKKDSSLRNKLPVLKEDFCCLWVRCGSKFKSMQAFLDHVALHTHYAPRLTCSWAGCGATFPRAVLLTTHVRSHTGERLLACYHCGRHFATNRKIVDHRTRQNVHPSSEHTCSVCSFSYATAYLLRQHTRQHISQHACTLCDMSAPTLATLAQHVRYRHLPDHCRTHKCPTCEHKAITKSDLRKHIETHTKKRKKEDSDISDEEQGQKKRKRYACHMCEKDKVFSRGSRLTTHLVKVHGVQWPFGHSRFRYQISEDGMYRLTTTRYEILEVSKQIVDGYSGPKDSLSNTFEFNLEQKSKPTLTTPTSFEISLKGASSERRDASAVEITMCDVDEQGNIICSEVIRDVLLRDVQIG
ncbi:histone H4 transcription factor isoform X5 [Leguminivora glycinivorella]|uniref:histone H4 transcription factor isoform X5 n=1 Tax=Leguminivora glycinivorella TaxID=1035111 RepID=UPI00200D2D10|nr:histone H4 transcription factor isoform X5 [Leguminivora glycinivorella]